MNTIFTCIFKRSLMVKNVSTTYRFSTSVICRNKVTETYQRPTYQPVADYYAGKSVFVTGGTGFVGRLLVERLLYTCKDIEKVYVLIRAKENATVQQRLQELLRNPIFTKLKETRPQDLNKIVPIAGDVENVRLGMKLEDEQTVIEKVSVIFHSAANVKFRAPLSEVLKANYEATKEVMELGKRTKKINVVVYLSTVFHNSKDPVVDEVPCLPPRNIEDTYKIVAKHSDDSNEIKKLLDKWENRYLFSKKMAEAYVASNSENMQTIIVRPSMVTSVYKEPLAGYTDSWVTGTGILCDIASGLVRVAYGKKDVVVELIPVDYVTNFLIVAAAKKSMNKKCNVYNLSTGNSNPINWGKLSDIYIKEGKKYDYVVMPFPAVYFTKVTWAIPVLRFITQFLPALAADTWLRLTGQKPRYIQLQKVATSRAVFSKPVTDSNWDIRTTRAREIISTLDSTDRNTFPCDPVTIDWDQYVPIYCKGVKDYMLGKKSNKK